MARKLAKRLKPVGCGRPVFFEFIVVAVEVENEEIRANVEAHRAGVFDRVHHDRDEIVVRFDVGK